MDAELEVLCGHADDARRAADGGADRVHLVATPGSGETSPPIDVVEETCAATPLPVRVSLRLRAGWSTDGGEVTRLRGLARAYADVGAEGFVMGFLDADSDIAPDVCQAIAGDGEWPWTFDRAVDFCLDFDRAWRVLRGLPGLDRVLTAGSARDVEHGVDGLIDRAGQDPWAAGAIMAGGGLRPEDVVWLRRAGVRSFHVDAQVRPLGSWQAWVDAGLVHSWRSLLDR